MRRNWLVIVLVLIILIGFVGRIPHSRINFDEFSLNRVKAGG